MNNKIKTNKYNELSQIVHSYNIEFKNISKIRTVYKISSNEKNYCLKQISHNKEKINWLPEFINYLKNNGFNNCVNILPNKNGNYFYKNLKDKYYYLTEWIDGSECNIDELNSVLSSIELLANFHIKAKGFKSKYIFYKKGMILNDFMDKIDDLKNFELLIKNKKIKTYFEIQYEHYILNQLEFAFKALDVLKNSSYLKYNIEAKKDYNICHNSFYYQNILFSREGDIYLIDYDKILYECKEYDIGKFIQRIMFRKYYNWDFEKARVIIDKYNEIYNLDKTSYEIILSIIIFPHKFWKLGDKRFSKNKQINEDYYIRRLNKIIQSQDKIYNFMNQFINTYIKE